LRTELEEAWALHRRRLQPRWSIPSGNGRDAAPVEQIDDVHAATALANAVQPSRIILRGSRIVFAEVGIGHRFALADYGAGISDSNQHDHPDIPIVLAGGGAGQIKEGRDLRFAKDAPLARLLVL
jgi:hypothetical protein